MTPTTGRVGVGACLVLGHHKLPQHLQLRSSQVRLDPEQIEIELRPVSGAMLAGETYNIGTDRERSVMEVAQDMARLFKLPEDKVVSVQDRAFNDRRYYIGSSKLAALGWTERTSWEDGLKKTVDWCVRVRRVAGDGRPLCRT